MKVRRRVGELDSSRFAFRHRKSFVTRYRCCDASAAPAAMKRSGGGVRGRGESEGEGGGTSPRRIRNRAATSSSGLHNPPLMDREATLGASISRVSPRGTTTGRGGGPRSHPERGHRRGAGEERDDASGVGGGERRKAGRSAGRICFRTIFSVPPCKGVGRQE